jgi:BASS family bile acid:Na+ symporter
MEALRHFLPLLVSLSLAALVLAVGLDAEIDDLLYFLRNPRKLLNAFLAISVAVPVVAVIAALALPLGPVSKAGLILMAVSPLPPLAPGKELKLGGRKCYVYGLYVTFAILAVVIVPLTMSILNTVFSRSVVAPVGALAQTVLLNVLVPLALGLVIRAAAPRFATAAAPLVSKLSMALLVLICIPIIAVSWPAMRSVIGDGSLIAIVAVVAAGLGFGHVLGGPDRHDRVALALAASTRHPGIALILARANGFDQRVTAVILLFLLTGLIAAIPYQMWARRSGAHAPKEVGQPSA